MKFRALKYVVDLQAAVELVFVFLGISYALAHQELTGVNTPQILRGNSVEEYGFLLIGITAFNLLWLVYRLQNVPLIRGLLIELVEEKACARQLGSRSALMKAGSHRLSYGFIGAVIVIGSTKIIGYLIRAFGF
jgi:hypothetical protein